MVDTHGESVADETAPLLHGTSQASGHVLREHHPQSVLPLRLKHIPRSTLVPIVGMAVVFFTESGFYIKQPAQVRAIEAMACYEYYSSRQDPVAHEGKNIPELMCKSTVIQERVAALYGTLWTIRMLSAVMGTFLILQVFKAGRKRPIILLHQANILVSVLLMLIAYLGYPKLPIWLISLSGITGIFGGNFDLMTSIVFATYADVISDATRRSNLIFVTTSLQYASQAICYPLASYLMDIDGKGGTSQVAFFASLGCSVAAFVLVLLFFPETYQSEEIKPTSSDNDGLHSSEHLVASQPNNIDDEPSPAKQKVLSTSETPYKILRQDFGLFRVIFMLLAMFLGVTSTRLVDWYGLIQYPSIKFHWKLSKTTYLVCMAAILSFINFILILPNINKLSQQKFGISARSTSVGIIIASSLILALSTTMLGLPGTTPVIFIIATACFTLGSGLNAGLQSYIVSVASSPRSSGAALTVISLAATSGKVAASALWPSTLALGLEHPSGKLEGLPFFVVAVLFACVSIVIVLADRVGKSKR